MSRIFGILFGCRHKRSSFPITPRPGLGVEAAIATGTYIVCLDCGREFPYSWEQMKVVKPTLNVLARKGCRNG